MVFNRLKNLKYYIHAIKKVNFNSKFILVNADKVTRLKCFFECGKIKMFKCDGKQNDWIENYS